jgi:hypothetical protein
MNKLASIYFLQKLNLPTTDPLIIKGRSESQVRSEVNSFYHERKLGWLLRCGELPDEKAGVERELPWDKLKDREDLVNGILRMQKEVGDGYVVFCHPALDLRRGGTMLVEGDKVIVEAAFGNDRELSAMFRGHRNPEQTIIFKPGMMSHTSSGKTVLTSSDLYDIRSIERRLNWYSLGALSDPVTVEFSWLGDGSLYVHDLSIVR